MKKSYILLLFLCIQIIVFSQDFSVIGTEISILDSNISEEVSLYSTYNLDLSKIDFTEEFDLYAPQRYFNVF